MNKTKIEWCDSTWNPVTGCRHGCEYCYARRIALRFMPFDVPCLSDEAVYKNRHPLDTPIRIECKDGKYRACAYPYGFEPTFHRYRLDEPQRKKKPQTIFVCSMADLFGDWVPDEWIKEVFAACEKAPQHRYLFLTKNPARYMKLAKAGMLPDNNNFWYGSTTAEPDAPFFWSDYHNTFVSIEPMLEPFPAEEDCAVKKVGWIILGAMTGPGSKARQPKKEWIDPLVEDALALDVPVFMKDSLLPIMGEENMRREWPWEATT